MAAASLAKLLGHVGAAIHLIESPEIGTVGVGEATLPTIRFYNAALGIDEREFMRATQATFKLAIQFVDWGTLGNSFFHAFGDYGPSIDGISPHHHWRKLRGLGEPTPLDAYSVASSAASSGRFMPPVQDKRSALASFSHAFHFDASLFARYLRDRSKRAGVFHHENKITGVDVHGETGFIEAVTLDSGERITGDLFIDCSGFRGLLIEQTLHTGYDDWSHWLPCNSAFAVPCENVGPATPYTRSTALAAGWQWRIPLQHRTGNGYVFCNQFIEEARAADALMGNLDGKALAEPRMLKFVTGRRKLAWNKNCIALGLAGGFLEPLESTSIQLIESGLGQLIDLFPDRDFEPALADEYNRQTNTRFESIRDFLVLHYHLSRREDSELWRYCRNMSIPDSLRHQIEVFQSSGRVVVYDQTSFLEPSWLAIFIGQGVIPRRHDPLIDSIDPKKLSEQFLARRLLVERAVSAMPTHEAFIAQYCGAQAAQAS